MAIYVALLRGINVGGKNKVPMAGLIKCFEELGLKSVITYIQSGNVIFKSTSSQEKIMSQIENILPKKFKLDSSIIKVLVLTRGQFQAIIDNKPKGFGEKPEKYHSDAIFLIGISAPQTMSVFNPKEGVDKIWQGKGVIYSQRLSSQRTKSRLNKIMMSSLYKSMTIRNWNTTQKIASLMAQKSDEYEKNTAA